MALRGKNLTVKVGQKAVKQKTIIEGVSIDVEAGEVVAIIGPNGAGKSTLLHALTGDTRPTTGTVTMGGKPLHEWKLNERAQVRAVLTQSSSLTFSFSVLEVVLMGRGPHVRGGESRYDYDVAYAALELVKVVHLADRMYTTLSGGERQRVQLARVLAQIWLDDEADTPKTRYLLMDEPTNNLDLTHQHGTLRVARHFAEHGAAVLAILHDLNLAAQYADKLYVLKQGKLLMEGTPEQVLTAETILQAFDMPVMVTEHPVIGCPLVVPIPGIEQANELSG